MSTRIGAGLQPRGRALPQLVFDSVSPEEHLEVALKVSMGNALAETVSILTYQ